jgi:cell division initiation protein
MALSPLEIQKMRFSQRMRGYDPSEVDGFLSVLAEELQSRLGYVEKLERELRFYRQKLEETEHREQQLQQTLLRAQRMAEEITANARREAELTVREAELTADKIVQQAVDQAGHFEAKITELRTARRELHLKFRNTLDLFQRILEAETEDERSATVHTLPRKRREAGA